MPETKANEVVTGSGNSTYAHQAGEGPVLESDVEDRDKRERKEEEPIARQEAQATIKSNPLDG